VPPLPLVDPLPVLPLLVLPVLPLLVVPLLVLAPPLVDPEPPLEVLPVLGDQLGTPEVVSPHAASATRAMLADGQRSPRALRRMEGMEG
jgi:hypothetical protein